MWGNKSGAGADIHPVWTLWSFIYTLSSATLLLNARIIWWDVFFGGSSFNVACLCSHCRWTNQNCSMMSLTRPVSCFPNILSLNRFSLSLIYLLELLSFDGLNVFDDECDNSWSGSGSPGTCNFPFSSGKFVGGVSGWALEFLFRLESSHLMTFLYRLCSVQEESIPKSAKS